MSMTIQGRLTGTNEFYMDARFTEVWIEQPAPQERDLPQGLIPSNKVSVLVPNTTVLPGTNSVVVCEGRLVPARRLADSQQNGGGRYSQQQKEPKTYPAQVFIAERVVADAKAGVTAKSA